MRMYLKKLREQSKFTQQEVADKLGMARAYYTRIENGERQQKMDIEIIQKACRSVWGIG